MWRTASSLIPYRHKAEMKHLQGTEEIIAFILFQNGTPQGYLNDQ
jgi:hypothetical protein